MDQTEYAKLAEKLARVNDRLEAGRDYLMSVQQNDITVEDALEAFGFSRNGLYE